MNGLMLKEWVKAHRRADVIYEDTLDRLYWNGFREGDWDDYWEAVDVSKGLALRINT